MGEAVGKREGEGKLRDRDVRGAGRKPEKGWKGRQGKERRESKGAEQIYCKAFYQWKIAFCMFNKEGRERDLWFMMLLQSPTGTTSIAAQESRKQQPPVLKCHCSAVPALEESKLRVQLLTPWVRMGREGVPRQHWSLPPWQIKQRLMSRTGGCSWMGKAGCSGGWLPSWAQLHWD